MRSLCFALAILLLSGSSPTFAQSSAENASHESAAPAPQAAFDKLKTLAGSWVGRLTTDPLYAEVEGNFAQFSLRVTSLGNAFVHEMSISGRPDHPVTLFHLDEDQLVLTHYCDAGNRPRMVGKVSPDGKTLEFDLVDLDGDDSHGHMQRAVFTFIDENHHTEEWTYVMPDGNAARARFDLQRTNAGSGASG
jgi:hypothetical protein